MKSNPVGVSYPPPYFDQLQPKPSQVLGAGLRRRMRFLGIIIFCDVQAQVRFSYAW
jgi:hypothetical protein